MLLAQIAKGVETVARSNAAARRIGLGKRRSSEVTIALPLRMFAEASTRQDFGTVSDSSPSVDQRGTLRMARHKRYDSRKTVRFQDRSCRHFRAYTQQSV
jgi:hypothetical protein